MKQKAVLIVGHFMPEIGYLEVHLANTLVRHNFDLLILTSANISPSKKKIESLAINNKDGAQINEFNIIRLVPCLHVGAMLIAKDIRLHIRTFNPNIIFIIGVGKIFPFPAYSLSSKYPIITYFGDNSDYNANKRKFRNLINRITKLTIKRYFYNIAFKHSYRIVAYTPETRDILARLAYKSNINNLKNNSITTSLGFDPNIFFFNDNERSEIRALLNLTDDDICFITTTRIVQEKKIEKIVDIIDSLASQKLKIHYVIIGFMNDSYGLFLQNYILNKRNAHVFHCLPFMPHSIVRKYYNAADIGIWTNAAITIQESMGTGLPVLLPLKSNLSHLITENVNGWYYSDNLNERLHSIIHNGLDISRTKVSEFNKTYSYDNLLNDVLQSFS